MGLKGENLSANARDTRDTIDVGLIPGLGRSFGGGHGGPLQDSCQRIPWTKEPSGLQSLGSQRSGDK